MSIASMAAVETISIGDAKTLREKLTGQKQVERVNKNSQKSSVKTTGKTTNKMTAKDAIKTLNKKSITVQNSAVPKSTEAKPLKPSQKGLALAREAKNEKNYILAIKRYNFILKHFARTPEAQAALLDKAQIYKDMGLEEQAAYNKNRASKYVRRRLNLD